MIWLSIMLGILSFLLGCWITHLLLKLWEKKWDKKRAERADLTDFTPRPVYAHEAGIPGRPSWVGLVIRHFESKGCRISGDGPPWIVVFPSGRTKNYSTVEQLKNAFEELERNDGWQEE